MMVLQILVNFNISFTVWQCVSFTSKIKTNLFILDRTQLLSVTYRSVGDSSQLRYEEASPTQAIVHKNGTPEVPCTIIRQLHRRVSPLRNCLLLGESPCDAYISGFCEFPKFHVLSNSWSFLSTLHPRALPSCSRREVSRWDTATEGLKFSQILIDLKLSSIIIVKT